MTRRHGAVLGIVGWSGAGKTTLIEAAIPRLRAAGHTVSTVKHAHHGVELDHPGKDSWRHRQAGATEVLVSSPGGWALFHGATAAEADLASLLARMAPADLVLVEGYKREGLTMLEVHRPSLGKPPLWPGHAHIAAVATDSPLPECDRTVLDLGDAGAIAAWLVSCVHSGITEP